MKIETRLFLSRIIYSPLPTLGAWLLCPIIFISGYRFSKAWRNKENKVKGFIYEYFLDTVYCNVLADKLLRKFGN